MHKIKTLDDAISVVYNIDYDVKRLLSYNGRNPIMISTKAYMQLVIITKALNGRWKPDYTNTNQYKYFPSFIYKPSFGLVFHACLYWTPNASVSSRLCFKNIELAEYAATQFVKLYHVWLSYLYINTLHFHFYLR